MGGRGSRTALGVAVWGVLSLLVVVAPARAEIQLFESSEAATKLGTVRKGKCKVRTANGRKYFGALAESTNGRFDLVVVIDPPIWRGYRKVYPLFYGDANVWVGLTDHHTDTRYSTSFPIPGTPPGVVGAGRVKFFGGGRKGRRKLGVGAYSVPGERDLMEGIAVAGRMKCKKPRRRR